MTEISLIDEVRTVRRRIANRLRELEPFVREYNELRQIAAEMGLEEPEAEPAASAAAPREPPAQAARRPQRARSTVARRNDPGELAAQVLEAVRSDPGKTVADYAAMLDVAPTALYRPVRELTTDGTLVKRARQLFPG
jgi:hypothetical protein